MSFMPDANITEDGDVVTWHDETQVKPSDADIETELQRLIAEEEAKQYQYKRLNKYPPIDDQLDALFHAGVFPEEMALKIQAIKDKYPRG